MASPIVLGIVTFFHDLFTAIWIGGLFIMGFIIIPLLKKSLKEQKEPENRNAPAKTLPLQIFQEQLQIMVLISILGLLITGILLNRANVLRPIPVSPNYATLLLIKHIIYGLMILIALSRKFAFSKSNTAKLMSAKKVSIILVYINLVLGIITVLFSGILPVIK